MADFGRKLTTLAGRNCDDPKLDYKDLTHIGKFMTSQSQIVSRKRTGFCAQCQRELKQAVKRARHMALMPFVQ